MQLEWHETTGGEGGEEREAECLKTGGVSRNYLDTRRHYQSHVDDCRYNIFENNLFKCLFNVFNRPRWSEILM